MRTGEREPHSHEQGTALPLKLLDLAVDQLRGDLQLPGKALTAEDPAPVPAKKPQRDANFVGAKRIVAILAAAHSCTS